MGRIKRMVERRINNKTNHEEKLRELEERQREAKRRFQLLEAQARVLKRE